MNGQQHTGRDETVTPTWWEWRQQQAERVPLDLEGLLTEAAERRERFLALFRRPEASR